MDPVLRTINAVISALFFICYTYQFLYIPLVLLKKRRPAALPASPHRYAVLIAARNEENVIAGLLDSLAAQTYDMSLVTVFVAADNCTDSTAAIPELSDEARELNLNEWQFAYFPHAA